MTDKILFVSFKIVFVIKSSVLIKAYDNRCLMVDDVGYILVVVVLFLSIKFIQLLTNFITIAQLSDMKLDRGILIGHFLL